MWSKAINFSEVSETSSGNIKWLKYFLYFFKFQFSPSFESYKTPKAQEFSHYTSALNDMKIMKQKCQLKRSYQRKETFIFAWGGGIQPTILVLTEFNARPLYNTLTQYLTHKSLISMVHKREKI